VWIDEQLPERRMIGAVVTVTVYDNSQHERQEMKTLGSLGDRRRKEILESNHPSGKRLCQASADCE
jgi:hypothetical protein